MVNRLDNWLVLGTVLAVMKGPSYLTEWNNSSIHVSYLCSRVSHFLTRNDYRKLLKCLPTRIGINMYIQESSILIRLCLKCTPALVFLTKHNVSYKRELSYKVERRRTTFKIMAVKYLNSALFIKAIPYLSLLCAICIFFNVPQ